MRSSDVHQQKYRFEDTYNGNMSQEFVKVATVQDIPEGKLKTVEVGSEKVVIANVGGKFYAIGATCTHQGWDLSEGMLEGETIVCAGHGSRWDLKTGQGKFVRPLLPEPVFDVKVVGADIVVKKKSL